MITFGRRGRWYYWHDCSTLQGVEALASRRVMFLVIFACSCFGLAITREYGLKNIRRVQSWGIICLFRLPVVLGIVLFGYTTMNKVFTRVSLHHSVCRVAFIAQADFFFMSAEAWANACGLSTPEIIAVSRLTSHSHMLGNINQNHRGDLLSRVRTITGESRNLGEEIPVFVLFVAVHKQTMIIISGTRIEVGPSRFLTCRSRV